MSGEAANAAIAFARAQIGKPYVFGATGPNSYDCSGLIQAAYKAAGVQISRTTYTQIFDGTEVKKADLLPGDLVFPDPGHVQLYVGNGRIIEAPQPGSNVRETSMWGFWRARRVATPGTVSAGGVSTVPASLPGVSEIQEFLKAAQEFNVLAGKIVNPKNWWRLAILLFGVLLCTLAIIRLSPVKPTQVVKIAGKVASKGAV